MRSVLLFKEIPPQTISDPPPYATACSKLGGRFSSPLRRHTMLPKDKQSVTVVTVARHQISMIYQAKVLILILF